ncbi:hypothetical protein FSP39_017536 [Pinctada imbricata]|uniref:Sorbitol dehydrogenase n=1 Tax=Pinctada imbricata TaxID=66713 RepID=A0AA88Y5G8_PINIB|nr:hypothetical protein FSP39_017536 [Pinctada imbricata]
MAIHLRRKHNITSDQPQNCKPFTATLSSTEYSKIPEPGNKEVLVAVQKVGICGTDVEIWSKGEINDEPINHTVPGHECSGIVQKIGKEVTGIKIGDRVAIYPIIRCGACNLCRKGDIICCNDFKCLSLTNYQYGGMMRYLVHPADLVFRMPDNVSFEEATFVEPLSVVLRACMKAKIGKGDNVLITGAGRYRDRFGFL